MIIAELGLRPCLVEEFPISMKDELKSISKAEKYVAQRQNLNRRKKRLKAVLNKTGIKI